MSQASHYRDDDESTIHARWECDVDGLPDIEFDYKPMSKGQWARHMRSLDKSKGRPDRLLGVADAVILEHVTRWDMRKPDDSVVSIEPDAVGRLNPETRLRLSNMIFEGARAADEIKNSSEGRDSESPAPTSMPETAKPAKPTS